MARDLHQTGPLRDSDEEVIEPPVIRRFRWLVSALMIVMMVGIIAIAAALIWRIANSDGMGGGLPAQGSIAVPEGSAVVSVSRSGSRLYLLVEDSATGARRIEERRAETGALLGSYQLIPIGDE